MVSENNIPCKVCEQMKEILLNKQKDIDWLNQEVLRYKMILEGDNSLCNSLPTVKVQEDAGGVDNGEKV